MRGRNDGRGRNPPVVGADVAEVGALALAIVAFELRCRAAERGEDDEEGDTDQHDTGALKNRPLSDPGSNRPQNASTRPQQASTKP